MPQTLDSRGHFWWSDDLPDAKSGLPLNTAAGSLTIDERGRIILDLDGILSDGIRSAIHPQNLDEAINDKTIVGLLYENSEYVVLSALRIISSRFGSASVSREKYQARYCLCGGIGNSFQQPPLVVDTIQLDLANLSEWIRDAGIRVQARSTEVDCLKQTFEYQRREFCYALPGAKWKIRFDLDNEIPPTIIVGCERISLRTVIRMEYESDSPIAIDRARETLFRFQDFFALLTGVYIDLGWPNFKIKSEASERSGTLFFLRNPPATEIPTITDLWSSFSNTCDQLGVLFEAFTTARNHFGPGIYLYLSCLRTESMFAENRFTTLITGLESLYRRDNSMPQESNAETERIGRILKDVQRDGDRTWLRKKLEHRAELSLEHRLCRLFEPLQQHLDAKRLECFAAKCAALRNDVTHFGGLRGTRTYSELLETLGRLTPALATLYHALILQRIGLASDAIEAAFNKMPVSWKIKRGLVLAGLKDEEGNPNTPLPSVNSVA